MKRRRIEDARARMARMGASLEELQEVLAARRQPDRSPLQAYILGEAAVEADDGSATEVQWPLRNSRSAVYTLVQRFVRRSPLARDQREPGEGVGGEGRARRRGSVLGHRMLRHAKAGALPMVLALALSLFGLVRLQPANTLWYQELTLTSSVETGDYACEPLKLEYTGLTHQDGKTTLKYALSGGGTQGFNCPQQDIAHIQIPVCFDSAVKVEGPLVAETHPGTADTKWKYAPKTTTPMLAKWDSKTNTGPLNGKGPFDPDDMRFSITFDRNLTTGDLEDAMSEYKAGDDTHDLGEVKVPKCPLPAAPAPLATSQAAPETDSVVEPEDEPEPEVIEEVVPEPEDEETPGDTKPSKPGPAMTDGQQKPPRVKPTPTPTPIGVAIYGGR
jgi:hypothetical protein